ncbi:MAG: NUDIX domain-containing protein [Clostridia bacterium]|nr:NUDIX domain-containing protein [Clostridia bacterium]
MEIWDLYNLNREKIGTHVRGTELPEDGYHLVVHVWLKDRAGRNLMTQRAANKPTFPLFWECVGGSVLQGESSINAAVRETEEEVGVRLQPEHGKLLFTKVRGTVDEKRYNDIVDVWCFEYDGEVNVAQNATTDEVTQVKWMYKDEIAHLREKGNLIYSIKDLDYFFKEMD